MSRSEEPDPELRDIEDLNRSERGSAGGRRRRAGSGYVFALAVLAAVALIALAWILAR